MRPSSSSGFSPVYVQQTATTGMLIFGKMSAGVRRIITGLIRRINTANTMNVYGRSSATRIIHMLVTVFDGAIVLQESQLIQRTAIGKTDRVEWWNYAISVISARLPSI